ncbi:24498_t:CDS:2, partial [Gigaspora margarita]
SEITEQHLILQVNEEIEEVSRLSQIEIEIRLSISNTIDDKRKKIEKLKGYQKAIYKARKLENNMAHKQRIEKNIQKRFSNFASNTKKMIDTRYKPKNKIDNVWYKGVKDEISIEELKVIIEEAPKGKAIGSSKVSNEMIKRLGNKAIKSFLKIMNACMKFQMVSNSWKKENV